MPLPILTVGLNLAAAGLKIFGDHSRLVEFAVNPIDIAAGHLGAENMVELSERLRRWYAGNNRIENQDLQKALMRSALLADYFCLLDSLPLQPGPLGPARQLRERFGKWLSPERLQGAISQAEEAAIRPALEACEVHLEGVEKGTFVSDTTLDPRRIEPQRLIVPTHDAEWAIQLTTAALADISEHKNLPARVEEIYQKRWFPYLCLAFSEELKVNPRVSAVFVPMQIATGFVNLEEAIREFRKENLELLGEVLERLAKIFQDNQTVLKEVLVLLAEILEEIRGLKTSPKPRPLDLPDAPDIVGRISEESRILEFAQFHGHSPRNLRFVSIAGEEGKGKSALAEKILFTLQTTISPLRIGQGRCATLWKRNEGYLPIVRALKSLMHGKDGTVSRLLHERYSGWARVLSLHKTTLHN